MTRFALLCLFVVVVLAGDQNNSTTCSNFNANFNIRKIIGSWYVVAIIPEKMFPDHKEQVTCYRVEFSETDVAGLRWLVNKTLDSKAGHNLTERISGTIVRQRYHSIPPFDVWSKSVEGVSGCFQQVLSLDTNKRDIHKAFTHDDMMQLHMVESKDSSPYLLQLLWGKMISVVIYRRKPGMVTDQLMPMIDMVTKLRGPQKPARICDVSLVDILGLRKP